MAEGIRINKYIADSGYCSRREADRLIAAGRVTLDGAITEMGSRVQPNQDVRIDGQPLSQPSELVYIAFYKPVAITCTTDPARRDNIIHFLNYPGRIFPIGRLDRDSEGLILLSNDGSIVNQILRPGFGHEKEYRVTVDKPLTAEFLYRMENGVPILDTVTLPCRIEKESANTFRIILTQGLNRQIRRMCEAFGYRVQRLIRIRIMQITIGELKPGQWRYLTAGEIAAFRNRKPESGKQPAEPAETSVVEDNEE
jgi:23S rRNA pseudouridine2604 synthase